MNKQQIQAAIESLNNTFEQYKYKVLTSQEMLPQTPDAVEFQTAGGAAIMVLAGLIAALNASLEVTFGPEDWN